MERKGRKRDTLLTTDQLMHKRMALRPFVSYASFDIEKYSDYGLWKYNKNPGKFDARDPETGKVDKEKMRGFRMEMFYSRKDNPQKKKVTEQKKRRMEQKRQKRLEAKKRRLEAKRKKQEQFDY